MFSFKFVGNQAAPGSSAECSIVLSHRPAGSQREMEHISQCSSIRELAAEVERLKRDLDGVLQQGRDFFVPISLDLSHSRPPDVEADDVAVFLLRPTPARHRTLLAARRKVLRKRLLRRQKKLARGSSWRRWLRIAASIPNSARFTTRVSDAAKPVILSLDQTDDVSNRTFPSAVDRQHPIERNYGELRNQ